MFLGIHWNTSNEGPQIASLKIGTPLVVGESRGDGISSILIAELAFANRQRYSPRGSAAIATWSRHNGLDSGMLHLAGKPDLLFPTDETRRDPI
jgi:hypothetical protein